MPIIDGKYVSPTWSNRQGKKIGASEMQDITDTVEKNQNDKMQKDAAAVAGNIAVMDANGNPADSGTSPESLVTDSELSTALSAKSSKEALNLTDKRLDNLYKLTQGQSWEYTPGTTPAYQQSVPAGSKAAEIGSIGGKTVVEDEELVSAKVTEVESVGKNLLPNQKTYNGTNTIYFNAQNAYGVSATLDAGTYAISVVSSKTASFAIKDVDAETDIATHYGNSFSFTLDATTRVNIRAFNANYASADDVSSVQLERGSTSTAYTPYVGTLGTLEIPSALRTYLSDKGYGWSAGTGYNSIEYLSTPLTFTDAATGQTVTSNQIYRQQLAGLALNVDDMDNSDEYPGWRNSGLSGIIGTGINSINIGALCIYGYGKVGGNTVGSVIPTGGLLIMSKQYFGLTQSEWKTQHAGETIDFIIPLATEKLYDISSYIPADNLLTVEAGGSLTFVQEGTELQIPNSTTYFVNLSEAV